MVIDAEGYPAHNRRRMHVIVAERALGKPLPKGAQVHHVNENRVDFRNCNLVICQDQSYHRLLHYRAKAYDATGNADAVRCLYCGQWTVRSDPDFRDYSKPKKQFRFSHYSCQRESARRTYPNKTAAHMKERSEARVKAGLCRVCGKERGVDGSLTQCRPCADKRNARNLLRKTVERKGCRLNRLVDGEQTTSFQCCKCSFEFLFSGATTFEEIRAALEGHVCYPAMSLKLSRPLASALVHTLLIFSIVCCLYVPARAQALSRDAFGHPHEFGGSSRGSLIFAFPALEQSKNHIGAAHSRAAMFLRGE